MGEATTLEYLAGWLDRLALSFQRTFPHPFLGPPMGFDIDLGRRVGVLVEGFM